MVSGAPRTRGNQYEDCQVPLPLLLQTPIEPGSHKLLPAKALPSQAHLALGMDEVSFKQKARRLKTRWPKLKSGMPWAPGPARSFQPCSHCLSRAARAKTIQVGWDNWARSYLPAFQGLTWAPAQQEPLSPGKNDTESLSQSPSMLQQNFTGKVLLKKKIVQISSWFDSNKGSFFPCPPHL